MGLEAQTWSEYLKPRGNQWWPLTLEGRVKRQRSLNAQWPRFLAHSRGLPGG